MKPLIVALAVTLPLASPVLAGGFLIGSPIDCILGEDCYIQQYVDNDPTKAARDFTCGALSYDGHKGTDFALQNRAMIQQNVAVLAGADGRIKAVRDGMPDGAFVDELPTTVDGKECGNGVVIDHGDGWETQYCHMKQGSVVVKSGQDVAMGDVLGHVGQSGKAAFPHVHLSVRKDGAVVDPFDPDGQTTCSSPGDSDLWTTRPDYQPGGLISTGLWHVVPPYDAIKAGEATAQNLPADSPALVVWGYMFGTRAGDIINLSIRGPDGIVISDDVRLPKDQAQAFRAIGKKRRRADWPAGNYTGTVTMIRGPQIISQRKVNAIVE